MRILLCLTAVLGLASPVFAQVEPLFERLNKLEANTAAINSTLAVQKNDILAIKDQQVEIISKLDALIKASNVKMVARPSAVWDGPRTFVATADRILDQMSVPQQTTMMSMSSMYGMGMGGSRMMTAPRTPVRTLFSRMGGGCAGGSCGR